MIDLIIAVIFATVLFHAFYKLSNSGNLPFIIELKIGYYSKKLLLKEDDSIYLKRGICFSIIGRRLIHKQKDSAALVYFEKALSDFNSALYLNKNNNDAFLQKGLLLLLMNRPIEAYEALAEAENLGDKRATKIIIENGMR